MLRGNCMTCLRAILRESTRIDADTWRRRSLGVYLRCRSLGVRIKEVCARVGALAVIASPRIVVQWNIFAGGRYLLPTSAVKNF
jgi:hypothetical protein